MLNLPLQLVLPGVDITTIPHRGRSWRLYVGELCGSLSHHIPRLVIKNFGLIFTLKFYCLNLCKNRHIRLWIPNPWTNLS